MKYKLVVGEVGSCHWKMTMNSDYWSYEWANKFTMHGERYLLREEAKGLIRNIVYGSGQLVSV